jgi:hypothetical protein
MIQFNRKQIVQEIVKIVGRESILSFLAELTDEKLLKYYYDVNNPYILWDVNGQQIKRLNAKSPRRKGSVIKKFPV